MSGKIWQEQLLTGLSRRGNIGFNNISLTNRILRNRVRFHMGFGAAAESILEYTANSNVDVIVMSVRQLDPFMAAHLPRSDTAYELISRAPCPVLTIR